MDRRQRCNSGGAACVCQRSNGRCVRPNRWNVFRAAHRGASHSTATLSALYRRTKSEHAADDWWCALADAHNLDVCGFDAGAVMPARAVVGGGGAAARTAMCRELVAFFRAQKPDVRYDAQWAAVMRGLRRPPAFPARIAAFTEPMLLRVANAVGAAFFGRTFVRHLRRDLGWRLFVNDDNAGPVARHNSSPANTGYDTDRRDRTRRRLRTEVNGSVIDHWCGLEGGSCNIENDGFTVQDRLEWLAHVVAHELIHCLQLSVCQERVSRGGHDAMFLDLNRFVVGGRGFEWIPRRAHNGRPEPRARKRGT